MFSVYLSLLYLIFFDTENQHWESIGVNYLNLLANYEKYDYYIINKPK